MILHQDQRHWQCHGGAAHRMYFDTPPLKGLRLETFGSIRNRREETMRCALSRFHPEPEFLARNRRKG